MTKEILSIDANETADGVKVVNEEYTDPDDSTIKHRVQVIDKIIRDLIGEVQDSPTANTLLARVKTLGTYLNSLDGKDFATELTLDTRLNNLELKLDKMLDPEEEFLSKLETIAVNTNSATDISNPNTLSYGDMDRGFFGIIPASEFITGDNLCSELGITQGTAQFSDIDWLKFAFQGDILITPMKPIRYGISWSAIYNAGAVYGDGTAGFNPPNGRVGTKLDIQSSDNSINITTTEDDVFLRDGAEIGSAGETLVLAGFADNDGEHVIDSITDSKIILTTASTLVDFAGTRDSRVWNKADEVIQDASVTVNGNNYTVRLMRGAAEDPTNSYVDSDRGSLGAANEWNALMLPIHEKAKLGNWNYSAYVPSDVPDWDIGFSDAELLTHYNFGNGSRRWMQETDDTYVVFRVNRGSGGVSNLHRDYSWNAYSTRGFAPALVLG